MKQYSSNTRLNKASYILASMSPDMVEDIIALVNQKGRALVNDLFDEEGGPPRPLAMLSREYIPDESFPAVHMGLMSVLLANMRTIQADFDFYEKTLVNAFSIPTEIASGLAKNIETYDILGGSVKADARASWLSRLGMVFQEGVRRIANLPDRVFGIGLENDQTQKYDIDFLYELKLLGETVYNLQQRAALMKGQAAIAASMGILNPAESGDIYGDVYGDPVDIAELQLVNAAKPLIGAPLPGFIFGGLRKLFERSKATSEANLDRQLSAAGATSKAPATDVALSTAYQRATDPSSESVSGLASPNISHSQLAKALELIKVARAKGESGDVYEEVAEQYGDAAAKEWAKGNVPAMMTRIVDMAGDALDSTGDRDLDEAIIGEVLSDCDATFGDVEQETDQELGGLFTRARINRQIRRGRRRQRKNFRRNQRQERRDARAAKLASARAFANSQYAEEQSSLPQNPYLADDYELDDAADAQFDNSGTSNPDDFYNVDQWFESDTMA